ncbi:hypothetical protein QBC37DRAFT_372075 [Rhypophila decipiens]|uniref:Clr5 domain-containing protein n=1 Tax=Rhypophila decipiens TaxID=261697 RepID=A0AAN6YAH6_9PEZI|nr:hypothetical protein QBC37DRAFT_372075 [Rhypophila decipiens]
MSLPLGPPAPTTSSDNTSTRPWSQSALTHTKADWEAMHPELERLYVMERRKLHEIMRYMETKHGFKATTQMYKKRFAKWGFQKNKKRWATADPALSVLNLACGDTDVKFMFLSSVRIWSDAFYEEPHRHLLPVAPTIEANEINFAFKMIIELLDRGYGELAGRVARKAFLLIEDLLTIDGPALIWNLLDLMHNMVVSHLSAGTDAAMQQQQHTTRLFQMLLVHLDGLVGSRFKVPETHPLSTILRLLKRLAAEGKTTQKDGGETHYPINPHTATLLEQAWGLNAKLIFDNFDPSLLHVYWYLGWDSCSINLPPHVVNVILERLGQLGLDHGEFSSRLAVSGEQEKRIVTPAVRRYLQSEAKWDAEDPPHMRHFLPLVPACHTHGPRNLVSQLTSSILNGLREYGKQVPLGISGAIDEQGKPIRVCELLRSTTDQTALLGTLAGLLATKVLAEVEIGQQPPAGDTWDCPLDHLPGSAASPSRTDNAATTNENAAQPERKTSPIDRERVQLKIQAMTTAWAIRISMTRDDNNHGYKSKTRAYRLAKDNTTSTEPDKPDDGPPSPQRLGNAERIKHLRKLIALQEEARGKVNLHVVREVWALEDELKALGETAQAKETNREWRRRLEAYLGDIPVQQA